MNKTLKEAKAKTCFFEDFLMIFSFGFFIINVYFSDLHRKSINKILIQTMLVFKFLFIKIFSKLKK
jgi:hypothetical protein